MAATLKVGFDAKCYHGAALAVPTTEITGVRDVSMEITSGDAESTDRSSSWKERLATMREGTATISLTYDGTNASYQALLTKQLARTVTSLKFIDAAVGKGLYGDFAITSIKRSFPLEGSASVEIKADLTAAPTMVD